MFCFVPATCAGTWDEYLPWCLSSRKEKSLDWMLHHYSQERHYHNPSKFCKPSQIRQCQKTCAISHQYSSLSMLAHNFPTSLLCLTYANTSSCSSLFEHPCSLLAARFHRQALLSPRSCTHPSSWSLYRLCPAGNLENFSGYCSLLSCCLLIGGSKISETWYLAPVWLQDSQYLSLWAWYDPFL